MTQTAPSHPRYRFPTSLTARLATKAGMGDKASPRQTATGENLGEGIYRFWHTKADRDAMPPSLALVSEPKVLGPASGAKVVPSFSRTWDGRECVRVKIEAGTDLYGTGETAGPLRRNGRSILAYNADRPGYTDKTPALYQSHPWVLAVRKDGTAFGVLADTTWHTEIDLTDGINLRSRGPAFNVYVIEAGSPQEVVKGLAKLTGTIDMPPRWALGYHQCRFSYEPDTRVLEVARGFRERQIPCDVVWMDIDYMDRFRIFTFDPAKFADPARLNADLHGIGFKSVWMIDPGAAYENDYFVFEQGTERDVWCKTWDGHDFRGPVWPPDCAWPDFTRPDVCEWWGGLYKDFMATGVDGVWNDMNEPAIVQHGEEGGFTMVPDARHSGGLMGLPAGPHAQYHNVFGYLMVRASREGIMKANPDKRPFVLTRANFIGGHRFAATWTGDNGATWNDVEWSIPMCLNMGLSGQPFIGPDLGGFMEAGTPDMMGKWWGFGTLLPFCRGHTTKGNIDKEPWSFGPEVEATIKRALQRRYRLLPYLYTLFREAHETGMPVIRPTFFADPANAALRTEQHSFLLGGDVLVLANVLESGTPTHAQPGGVWRGFEPVEGPEDHALAGLKIRGGAIVPMGPVMEWTDQRPLDEITLVVCLDEKGEASGELYEDAGEGHGHRSGDFCKTRFTARREGGEVVVSMSVVGGQRPPMDRAIRVEVIGETGVGRGEGRWGETLRVHAGEIRYSAHAPGRSVLTPNGAGEFERNRMNGAWLRPARAEEHAVANPNKTIGYFTMEIGIDDTIPTYCGGLGMLAGDTIKAAADLGLPMVACTLLYRGGYLDQSLDSKGRQQEKPVDWDPGTVLEEMPQRVFVPIEGRNVIVRCFRKIWKGVTGKYVPIYFLDTDLPENTPADRKITERLYIGDDLDKLRQRAVLGIAGPRMLRALTHDVAVFHMNEGHGVLLTMELMSEHLSRFDKQAVDAECVRFAREKCVFTTHTPVPAGHDQFKVADVRSVVGDHPVFRAPEIYGMGPKARTVHASIMALNLSRYANGVAKRHGEVSREMFPGYAIDSVTNGIHAPTWASPEMQAIFDKHMPDWRVRSEDLRLATSIPDAPLLSAHATAKKRLVEHVNKVTDAGLEEGRFTITFARRATPYKRPTLFMHDIDRLLHMNKYVHPIQILFTGKAHPNDGKGKDAIQEVLTAAKQVKKHFPITWIPNYNMDLGAKLTSGSDLWLNNPKPPLEASGTSGMKAALNGVPSLSSLDGWWIEGHSEHVTGWSIDGETEAENAASIYDKLEEDILPVYRDDQAYWAEIMRSCIAINGSHFTTIRMLKDYVLKAYFD